MANPNSTNEAVSLSDFPEDVQLCILSFLTPSEVSTFASTSKRSLSLCRSDVKLWFSLCHRRWGSKTQIHKWTRNGKKITYKRLYKILDEYESLIGFWRRSGNSAGGLDSLHPTLPPLVFFEWGPSFITGSRISPCKTPGSYNVVKAQFIWLGVMENGSPISFADPECRLELGDGLDTLVASELDQLVPVNVSFMGRSHVVVEENLNFSYSGSGEEGRKSGGFRRVSSSGHLREEECNGVVDEVSGSPGSLPDRLVSEIYQYFANRTSPGGDRASRRQKRREKERQGRRRKWEPEHFVKIDYCSPTRLRPLQGLWKVVFLFFFGLQLLISRRCIV